VVVTTLTKSTVLKRERLNHLQNIIKSIQSNVWSSKNNCQLGLDKKAYKHRS